jgi:hypothetical protein
MGDWIDKAQAVETLFQAQALSARAPEGPPACGACYYCGALLKDGRRWCDAHCRDDWQREQDAIAREGGVRP